MVVSEIIQELNKLNKPLYRSPFETVAIIQLSIIVYIIFESAINLYNILQYGSLSSIDLTKIIIDLLLISGFAISLFAYYTENEGLLKNGYLIFIFGNAGLLILIIFDFLKIGFSFGCLIKFFVYLSIMICLCVQAREFNK